MGQHLLGRGPQARRPKWEPRFPPRSQLPRGITVPKIPWVGTTWYERGVRYWVLRLALTVFAAVFLALYTGILFLFFKGIYQTGRGRGFFWGLLAAEIVYSLITGGWLLIRTVRRPAVTGTAADNRGMRRLARFGPGVGILAWTGSALAVLFFVLLAALSYGLVLFLFAGSFRPLPPPERQARERLTQITRLQKYLVPEIGLPEEPDAHASREDA